MRRPIGGKRKLTETEFLKVLGDNAGQETAALAKQAIQEAADDGLNVGFGTIGAALKFEDEDSSEVFNLGNIGKDGKLQSNGLFCEKCVDLKIPRSIWQNYYDGLVALIPGSKRVPWPKRPELDWVADENGDDWPSATPLLRNRKKWFKIIKDMMAQIRPLLSKPSK
jgi:hypothetical protein